MEFGVGLLEIGNGQAQIAFGGRNGTVAQQVLDVAEAGVILHQVSGTGVPQRLLTLLMSSRRGRFITGIIRFADVRSK
jgi:hypothetical protein